MQQTELKAKWSSAVASVDSQAMQLQQDLNITNQQLRDEEERLQQLNQAIAALQQKAALVTSPAEAAAMQTRYRSLSCCTIQLTGGLTQQVTMQPFCVWMCLTPSTSTCMCQKEPIC